MIKPRIVVTGATGKTGQHLPVALACRRTIAEADTRDDLGKISTPLRKKQLNGFASIFRA